MAARVFVHTREDYDQWLKDANAVIRDGETAITAGERWYKEKNCITCHKVDGNKLIGPPLNLVFGAERKFNDGTSRIADENYIRESILNPNAQVVEGYPAAMTSYQGIIRDGEIDTIIAYLKHLAAQN